MLELNTSLAAKYEKIEQFFVRRVWFVRIKDCLLESPCCDEETVRERKKDIGLDESIDGKKKGAMGARG